MGQIHLICGFMGFGKTTLAKRLEKSLPAVRLTHDELMQKAYGRNPDNFDEKYKIIDDLIWAKTAKLLALSQNVILDYGFWDKKTRAEVLQKALRLTEPQYIIWHLLDCDMAVAKARILKRSKTDADALFIDENCFDMLAKKWQPITADEHLNVIEETNVPV